MKRLKYILKSSKYLYIILALTTIILTFLYTKFNSFKSKYQINEEVFYIRINTYQIDGDKLTIAGIGKENIIINYVFKTEEEKNSFNNQYHLNDLIEVKGKLEVPIINNLPNAFNYQEYLFHNNIRYLLKANCITKKKSNTNLLFFIKDQLLNRINQLKSKTYLKIFLLGNKDDLSQSIINTYNKNGIIHLFSISGMHISLFTTSIFFLTKKLSYNYRYPYYATIIFLIFYVLLIGISPSILRSLIMYLLFTINKIYQLKIKKINVLLFGLSIILIIKPFYLYNIGFYLSFLISSTIILLNKRINKYSSSLKKLLIISILSFLISLPLVLLNNYQINYLSILYNLFFIPFVTYLIFPLSLLTIIFPLLDPIFWFLTNILEYLSVILNQINTTIIFIKPTALFIIIYYIILYFVITSKKIILFILLLFLLIFLKLKPFFNPNYYVTFIDVSQGDSILIRYPYNRGTVLIDTGGLIKYPKLKWQERESFSLVKSKTIPYMKSIGIDKIDYLVISHGDYDHMGEAINLVNNFKVEKVIFNCGGFNNLEKDLIKVLDKNKISYYSCIKELSIGNSKLSFINNQDYGNENDNSSVIYTELNNHKFLFMGDAGVEVEEDLINKYNLQDIDVLKVGHHGSKTSSSEKFINEINPKYSTISVGKNNRYGHPNKEVLNELDASYICRTDRDGSIMFKIKENLITKMN